LCVFSCPRLAYKVPVVWAEARRNCQQEGATLVVVNSEEEAEILRFLYFIYGPVNVERGSLDSEKPEAGTPPLETTPSPITAGAIIHVGFSREFITVHGK